MANLEKSQQSPSLVTLRNGKTIPRSGSKEMAESHLDDSNNTERPSDEAMYSLDSEEELELRQLQKQMIDTPKSEWSNRFAKHNFYDLAIKELFDTEGASGISDATFKHEILKMVQEYRECFSDKDELLQHLHSSLSRQMAMQNPNIGNVQYGAGGSAKSAIQDVRFESTSGDAYRESGHNQYKPHPGATANHNFGATANRNFGETGQRETGDVLSATPRRNVGPGDWETPRRVPGATARRSVQFDDLGTPHRISDGAIADVPGARANAYAGAIAADPSATAIHKSDARVNTTFGVFADASGATAKRKLDARANTTSRAFADASSATVKRESDVRANTNSGAFADTSCATVKRESDARANTTSGAFADASGVTAKRVFAVTAGGNARASAPVRPEYSVIHGQLQDNIDDMSTHDTHEGAHSNNYHGNVLPNTPIRKETKEKVYGFRPKSPLMKQSLTDPDFVQDLYDLIDSSKQATAAEALLSRKASNPSRRRSAYLPDSSDSDEGSIVASHSHVENDSRPRQYKGSIPLRSLKLPSDLKFDGTEDWQSFHTKFKLYVAGYEKDNSLVGHLMSCLTGQARQMVCVTLKQFEKTGQPAPDYDALCRILSRNYYRTDDTSSKLTEFQSASQRSDESHVMFRNRLSMLYMDAFPGIAEDIHEANVHARFLDGLNKRSKSRIWASKDKTSQELARILDDMDSLFHKSTPSNSGHILAHEEYDEYDEYEFEYPEVDSGDISYAIDEDYFGCYDDVPEDGDDSNYCAVNFSPLYPRRGPGNQRGKADGSVHGMTFREYSKRQDGPFKSDATRYNGRMHPRFRGRRQYRGGGFTPNQYSSLGQSRGQQSNFRRGFGNRNSNQARPGDQSTSNISTGNNVAQSKCAGCGSEAHTEKLCPVIATLHNKNTLQKIKETHDNIGKQYADVQQLLNSLGLK